MQLQVFSYNKIITIPLLNTMGLKIIIRIILKSSYNIYQIKFLK